MKSIVFVLALSLIGALSVAQTPTSEQINTFKNLPQDQQDALMQSVLGKSDGTGKKTDPKLNMPDTLRSKSDQLDAQGRPLVKKTADGHILRIQDEDPELRADDAVLIDLTPIAVDTGTNGAGNGSGATTGGGVNESNGVNAGNGANTTPGAAQGTNAAPDNKTKNALNTPPADFGRTQVDRATKTDEQIQRSEDFRDRLLKNNPYKLNRFGVLEIPGLPAIPLAGLTAAEASRRLSADPDLRDYTVRLTLLRLNPLNDESLKPFGYDLFQGDPSTFAPVSDIQVPMDYVIGPGDALHVQLYGNEPATYGLTVNRDGRVNFPKLGPILVGGLSFDSARALLEQRVAQQLIGTRVSVTMGDLRSIRVFVLGEAEKPGSYTVSGLSTMTNALFVSGGVKKIGSLRNIQLKRNGHLVTVLDLYDLLLHGDTTADRDLKPGDVIFIPPIGETVSVYGAVRRPAIYELKTEKNVAQVLDLAGGLQPDADGKLIQLERIQSTRQRAMLDVDLTTSLGRDTALANGDKLHVLAIRPTLEHSVTLSGFVYRPGAFEYRAGLRLSNILGSFDELRPNADQHYIMIRRQIPPQQKIEVISADLERALHAPGSAMDPVLQPRDQIVVFDISASRERTVQPVIRDLQLQATPDKPAQIVTVDGEVKAPGRYPLEPDMRISDLIRAGGSLDDSAYGNDAELTRYEVIGGKARETALIAVNLEAIRHGDSASNLQLKPYDVLVIKVTPQWLLPGNIVFEGEVRFPGKYPIHRGETLNAALQRAGGLTDLAFAEGAVFTRDELRQREREQLRLLTNRLQSDLTSLSLEALATSAATSTGNGQTNAAEGIVIGERLISQLRDAKPVGRLVIDINQIIGGPIGGPGDVALRDGDKLIIPKITQDITILGEVQSPTSHVFRAGMTRDEYIARSGGATQKADLKRIYVVRANGDVVSGGRTGWFRRTQSTDMRPGDTIVVPLDTERVKPLPFWTQVTTIIYNLAVALLAIHSVNH